MYLLGIATPASRLPTSAARVLVTDRMAGSVRAPRPAWARGLCRWAASSCPSTLAVGRSSPTPMFLPRSPTIRPRRRHCRRHRRRRRRRRRRPQYLPFCRPRPRRPHSRRCLRRLYRCLRPSRPLNTYHRPHRRRRRPHRRHRHRLRCRRRRRRWRRHPRLARALVMGGRVCTARTCRARR